MSRVRSAYNDPLAITLASPCRALNLMSGEQLLPIYCVTIFVSSKTVVFNDHGTG